MVYQAGFSKQRDCLSHRPSGNLSENGLGTNVLEVALWIQVYSMDSLETTFIDMGHRQIG